MKKAINFLKSIKTEIGLVEFPTLSETINSTNLVIIISIMLGITLLFLDTLFISIRDFITFNI